MITKLKIKLAKLISRIIGPVSICDKHGNEIYYVYGNKVEKYNEYDSNGNCIYHMNIITGYKKRSKFDNNNNEIWTRDSDGNGFDAMYNEFNKETYYANVNGVQRYCDYDDNGNCIHMKYIDAFGNIYESYGEYDSHNRGILFRDSLGNEMIRKFDDNGNCIYVKENSVIYEREFDEKGNLISYKTTNLSKETV